MHTFQGCYINIKCLICLVLYIIMISFTGVTSHYTDEAAIRETEIKYLQCICSKSKYEISTSFGFNDNTYGSTSIQNVDL